MTTNDENAYVCNQCANDAGIVENWGTGREEVHEFAPTKHELYLLAKHWVRAGARSFGLYRTGSGTEDVLCDVKDAFFRCLEIEDHIGSQLTSRAVSEAIGEVDPLGQAVRQIEGGEGIGGGVRPAAEPPAGINQSTDVMAGDSESLVETIERSIL